MIRIFFVVSILFFSAPLLAADFTRDSLLVSWEALQKNDPQTIRFEKTKDGAYEFETRWFPYKGRLRVLNVALNSNANEWYDEYNATLPQGVVEIELVDAPADFMKKFSTSYYWWSRNNTLSFDEATQTWMTPDAYRQKQAQQQAAYHNVSAKAGCWQWLNWEIFLYVVLGLFLLLIVSVRRNVAKTNKMILERQARAMEISEESLLLSKDNQVLFKKMLTQLEKIGQSS